jgi:hypothetical protein
LSDAIRSASSEIRLAAFSSTALSPNGRVIEQFAQTARRLIGRFQPLPTLSIVVAGAPQLSHLPSVRLKTCLIALGGAMLTLRGLPPPIKNQNVWPNIINRSSFG